MARKTKESYQDWLEELKRFQLSDRDQRENAIRCDSFVLDDDGQWDDDMAAQLDSEGRPRYTFDKITPIIEAIMADIEDMDFAGVVKPAGGEASKDVALTLTGMLRSIQNSSQADTLYRSAARRIVRRGFDAWIVKADYDDPWSFEQDLMVVPIANAVRRVWVSDTCTRPDSADSDASYVLTSMSPEAYRKKWPKGSGVSVDDGELDSSYDQDYQPEVITIAERYYPIETKVDVAQLSNGDVVRLDEKWEAIKDERAAEGITVVNEKTIDEFVWYNCAFDGGGILTDPRPTIHKSNPVVTVYGNYEIQGQGSKVTYSGVVLKNIDAQQVHNSAKSREIEEGSLAPRGKWWMTKAQAKGHTEQIGRMNISADPVQFYNADGEVPPPQYAGGPQVNMHLANTSLQMASDIKEQAGVFSAMQGDFGGRMSEDAVRMQIDRGTASTRKWVNSLVNGIQRTCELLLEAIPDTYDTKRQFDIVGEDGTEDTITLNDEVYDQQTQTLIKVNNLNAGKYKVTCDAGAAFSNKLEAGLAALLEYATIDPSIVQLGGDVMLKSIDAPLVDKIAARKRAQLLQSGAIPPEEMTDQEKQEMEQQMRQPKEPDAMMVAAQAEQTKAQADLQGAANDQMRIQLEMKKIDQADRKQGVEEVKVASNVRNTDANTVKTIAETQKIGLDMEQERIDSFIKQLPYEQLQAALSRR